MKSLQLFAVEAPMGTSERQALARKIGTLRIVATPPLRIGAHLERI